MDMSSFFESAQFVKEEQNCYAPPHSAPFKRQRSYESLFGCSADAGKSLFSTPLANTSSLTLMSTPSMSANVMDVTGEPFNPSLIFHGDNDKDAELALLLGGESNVGPAVDAPVGVGAVDYLGKNNIDSIHELFKLDTTGTGNKQQHQMLIENHDWLNAKVEQEQQQPHVDKKQRRRDSHKAVERRRRDNINDRIIELGTLIPAQFGEKSNKGETLRKTLDYIRYLQETHVQLQDQLRKATTAMLEMSSELEKLRSENSK